MTHASSWFAVSLLLFTACHSTPTTSPAATPADGCEKSEDPAACREALSEPEGAEHDADECDRAPDPAACREALSEPEGAEHDEDECDRAPDPAACREALSAPEEDENPDPRP